MQNIGIDFGTTNTVAAFTQADGSVRSASFCTGEVFRSVLCFWLEQEKVRRLFDDRFGAGRVAGGGELVSVAEGLALIAPNARSDKRVKGTSRTFEGS